MNNHKFIAHYFVIIPTNDKRPYDKRPYETPWPHLLVDSNVH